MMDCGVGTPVLQNTTFENVMINPGIISDDSEVVQTLSNFSSNYFMSGYNLTINCTD